MNFVKRLLFVHDNRSLFTKFMWGSLTALMCSRHVAGVRSHGYSRGFAADGWRLDSYEVQQPREKRIQSDAFRYELQRRVGLHITGAPAEVGTMLRRDGVPCDHLGDYLSTSPSPRVVAERLTTRLYVYGTT